MSKTLELAVKLQGHFDASFGSMFKSADNILNGFNKKVVYRMINNFLRNQILFQAFSPCFFPLYTNFVIQFHFQI